MDCRVGLPHHPSPWYSCHATSTTPLRLHDDRGYPEDCESRRHWATAQASETDLLPIRRHWRYSQDPRYLIRYRRMQLREAPRSRLRFIRSHPLPPRRPHSRQLLPHQPHPQPQVPHHQRTRRLLRTRAAPPRPKRLRERHRHSQQRQH